MRSMVLVVQEYYTWYYVATEKFLMMCNILSNITLQCIMTTQH